MIGATNRKDLFTWKSSTSASTCVRWTGSHIETIAYSKDCIAVKCHVGHGLGQQGEGLGECVCECEGEKMGQVGGGVGGGYPFMT